MNLKRQNQLQVKTTKKTSASSSLEREKPGPSSYKKNEPKKREPAASKTRKKTSASSSLEREKPRPSDYQKRQREVSRAEETQTGDTTEQ